jgi:hypothetical protein
VLSRIIDEVKSDPAQLRWAIYEVARARLKIDSAYLNKPERERLATALETAIDGVESFSASSDGPSYLMPPASVARLPLIDAATYSAPPASRVGSTFDTLEGDGLVDRAEADTVVSRKARLRKPHKFLWIAIASCLVTTAAGLAWINQHGVQFRVALNPSLVSTSVPVPSRPASEAPSATTNAKRDDVPPVAKSEVPLPTVFGIYALHDGELSELEPLAEAVPDKRVAISTPITKLSRTTLPDGKVSFVVYRRDSVDNSPDRFDVRVVARIERAVTFGANGKPAFTPVENTWSIRQFSYQFRVRPMPNGPGMLLVQPEKSDFRLPAGRYILVLKNQGYDFTVAGKVIEPSQCLEQTEASNGTFYSDCPRNSRPL